MSPISQRIAIAKRLGFKPDGPPDKPEGIIGWRLNGVYWSVLPDYLNSLDAMAEAEDQLIGRDTTDANSLAFAYSRHIYFALVPYDQQPFRATAAQRAKALLRTLGLWVES